MAPLEVLQLLIVVTNGGVAPLEEVVGPTLEVVLSCVLVVTSLEVLLASGLVDASVGLVNGPLVHMCPISLV